MDRIPGLSFIHPDEETTDRIPGIEYFYSDEETNEPGIQTLDRIPGLDLVNPDEEKKDKIPGMEFLHREIPVRLPGMEILCSDDSDEETNVHDREIPVRIPQLGFLYSDEVTNLPDREIPVRIPGLDLAYQNEGLPGILDPNFLPESKLQSLITRREDDFYLRDIKHLKAPITICKGIHLFEDNKVTIVIHDPSQEPLDDLTEKLHELELIKEMNHENVLKFREIVTGATFCSLSLVFEPHGSLMSNMIEKNIKELSDPIIIKTIIRDLFTALAYLHQNHIIHGDIQPENIVFSSTGVLKVWNFRSARRVGQRPKERNVFEFRYQPIEVILGSEPDQSVDIWSANCIFVQLWLKEPIFPVPGREKVMERIFNLLGFPTKKLWSEFFSLQNVEPHLPLQELYKKNFINKYFQTFCDHVVSDYGMELIHRCFRYNPRNRPRPDQVLLHPYFFEKPEPLPKDERIIICEIVKMANKK